ncbi:uncharacterized protein PgNI_06953 [Pyricularia grisea]|uniref:Uncharacterized protein n=1 Tax=Pyricularia grisea TaxID=148305 RepID=A0A6P8B1C4_PYRGI|nr:uncharacterized protein PgNI_06953 [Pyricularia grisea]TLD08695.1 hypothetical protein PgNI_06953 [Pyricularia grisea]
MLHASRPKRNPTKPDHCCRSRASQIPLFPKSPSNKDPAGRICSTSQAATPFRAYE